MTRDLAKAQTIRKFTNLLDGKVLSGISVIQVINYYEALVLGLPTNTVRRVDGITANFMEEEFNEMLDEEDHWY